MVGQIREEGKNGVMCILDWIKNFFAGNIKEIAYSSVGVPLCVLIDLTVVTYFYTTNVSLIPVPFSLLASFVDIILRLKGNEWKSLHPWELYEHVQRPPNRVVSTLNHQFLHLLR